MSDAPTYEPPKPGEFQVVNTRTGETWTYRAPTPARVRTGCHQFSRYKLRNVKGVILLESAALVNDTPTDYVIRKAIS